MEQEIEKIDFEDPVAIHQHYIDVLNCVPDVVYWVDNDCILKGCNHNFVEMLGLENTSDLGGTPYEQMKKFTGWPEELIESFKLEDMKVIFSGAAQNDVEEMVFDTHKKERNYFSFRRIPLFDKNKQVVGLVVVLTDITENKKLEEALEKSSQQVKKKPPRRKTVKGPHVLLVEDNLVAQKVEEALLKTLQCQVDAAETGEKALELFSPGKYDMIFMDIGLEDTSGYMIAKKIRQLEEKTRHRVPIIALTSYQADVVKHDCKDYQMDGALTKPLTSEQAEQLIKYYIHQEDITVTGLRTVNDE